MHKHESLTIFTDGGARGNPGPAGVGLVIFDESGEKLLATHKKYIGEATNNVAEYSAVILAMEEAKKMGAEELGFVLDSELVVKQLNGEYKVKNEDLGKLFIKIYNLRQQFRKVTFRHVPREQNKLADKLVNEAIDSRN
ncbi:ribonuclease HI family protein [Candidatus Kuenenbacteria bacterium]|nr:ribonuclease HI family protein [Candidatus Kuenenbacteria bacterium]